MKITVKTDPETLFLLHRLVLDSVQIGTKKSSAKSMKAEIFEILAKRCIVYSANPNGKSRTITLRYHLAETLFDAVTYVITHPSLGTYERNKLEIFKNNLHRLLL